jgi:hypothetical protein
MKRLAAATSAESKALMSARAIRSNIESEIESIDGRARVRSVFSGGSVP